MSVLRNVYTAPQDTAAIDAFGRLRVSQISSQLSVKQLYDNLPLYIDQETGGTGSIVHNIDETSSTMTTSTDGDFAIMQTKRTAIYGNAKSQELFWTNYDFSPQVNIVKRFGYYSSIRTTPFNSVFDGFFIESANGVYTLKVFKRGIQTAERERSQWNDPLDGTGASGVNANLNLNFIHNVDFEWLGVGRVRYFYVTKGAKVAFHEFDFTNGGSNGVIGEPSFKGVYMASPNQPLRWEIRQVGVGSGTLTTICSTVGSEGDISDRFAGYGANNGNVDLDADTINTLYAAVGIRLKSDKLFTQIDLKDVTFNASTNDDFHYEIWLNPTVAGTFTYVDDEGCVQIAWGSTANTVSGGTRIYSGVLEGANSYKVDIINDLKIGSNINGSVDELVICIRPITAGLNIFTDFNWEERL